MLFFECVRLIVYHSLRHFRGKVVVSRREQNHYGWQRRTLVTARLIKLYGGLRLMKSAAAFGGG